ncbi:MAG: M15 family metallopeptidase [Rickettsiaceae bacterium]|nr:M15 family metallopeptidase [Rickettsiaceae bacterium]
MQFLIKEVPSVIVTRMIEQNVWQESCPVPIYRLKLLDVSHYNFENQISRGQLVVLDRLAQNVLDIFKELFALKFPVHSIKLIDEFGGSDDLSMAANNSSCFNFRYVANSSSFSMHSYGLAIDINPLQNPCLVKNNQSSDINIAPEAGKEFLDRSNQRKGMVEPIVKIFEKYGFDWGGNWSDPIDYHHFQVPRVMVDKLITIT